MSPDHTPTVAYSTVLDQYMVACNVVIFMMAAENGFVRLIANNDVWYWFVCDESTDVWLSFWEGLNVTGGTVNGASQQESRLFCATQVDFLSGMLIFGLFAFLFSFFTFYSIYVRQKGSHLENVRELAKARRLEVTRNNLHEGDLAKAGFGSSRSFLSNSSNRSNARSNRAYSAATPSPKARFKGILTPIPAPNLDVTSTASTPTAPPAATAPPATTAPPTATAPPAATAPPVAGAHSPAP